MPDLKAKIIDEIRKIYDPELPVNIYELGLIYDIKVENVTAKVKMTLTTPNCPVAESLPKEVKDSIMQVEGIEKVDLDLVWDKLRVEIIRSGRIILNGSVATTLSDRSVSKPAPSTRACTLQPDKGFCAWLHGI